MVPVRIRTFSHHYREKYGFGVGKIPLDLGNPCPNREKGGCIFCHAPGFTPRYLLAGGTIGQQIEQGKKHLLGNRFKHFFAYFQQETPTSQAAEQLLPLFAELLKDPHCIGLIISTRPDFIENRLLQKLALLIDKTAKECLIELGLQSVHERSLQVLNRNHTYDDFLKAYEKLRKFNGFQIGAHLLFGIPGESEEEMEKTVRKTCALGVDALKLHHLQVLYNTPLQTMYEKGEYHPYSMRQYFDFLLEILPVIPAEVVIHRLWATAHPHLLIAPKWNILATKLSAMLQRSMVEKGICQGDYVINKP